MNEHDLLISVLQYFIGFDNGNDVNLATILCSYMDAIGIFDIMVTIVLLNDKNAEC